MALERHSWPDVDGSPVGLGDWIEVFCSWTHDPKFDGRAVQIVDVLRGGRGVVFRLRDPVADAPHLYVLADGHGYRRVAMPHEWN
jgi:hypothetical protein